jgi:hypothetical protein
MRLIGVSDVVSVLEAIPREFLPGLRSIYLMGGTWKQDKIALGDLYYYGECGWNTVYLYAFPRRRLHYRLRQLAKPDIRQEFERAGAVFRQDGDGWICEFDETSLRTFYLYDVLIHEIGHHVDRDNWGGKTHSEAEGFAEWFVREHGLRRKA